MTPPTSELDPIVLWAATGFVILHALTAFNSPPTSRSFTTAARYYAAAAIYVLVFVLLFLVVGRSPELAQWLVNGTPDGKPQPLFAALIVTILVPAVPPLSTIDDRLRAFLQRSAAIPLQALRLSDELRKSTLSVSETDQQAIRNDLGRLDFRPADIVFEPEATYQYQWTRLSTLRHFVKRWELTESPVAATRNHFRRELDDVDNRYMLLSIKAKRVFVRIPRGSDPITDEHLAELVRDYADQAEDLERRLYELLSRAALHRNMTENAFSTELHALGFDIPIREGTPISDKLAVLFMGLFAWYVATNVVMPPPPAAAAPGRAAMTFGPLSILVLAGGVAATHCFAVYWALVMKDTGIARRANAQRRWLSYAVACGYALGTAFMTSFLLQLFFFRGIDQALTAMQTRWPWALMAIATAFMTSFNCDRALGGRHAKLVAAGIQAAATVAFALVVRHFLVLMAENPRPAWQICIKTGVTGAAIGWSVPGWYREWTRPQAVPAAIDGPPERQPALAA